MDEFDVVDVGGMGKVPPFRLALSQQRTGYEEWLVHSRCWSPLHEALVEMTGPDSFFIDVGANIGSVICPVAATGAATVGIEPVPSIFMQLVASVRANGFDNVGLFNVGVSNLDHIRGVAELGPNSHINDAASQKIVVLKLDTLFDLYLARASAGRRLVIKVDVEGHEPEVFAGADKLLHDRHPIVCFESIVIEGEDHAAGRMLGVKQKFATLGYALFQFLEGTFYEVQPAFPQFEHVCDYVALPPDAPKNVYATLSSAPMPVEAIVKTVERMATFPVKQCRQHAAGLLKSQSARIGSYLDIAALVERLRADDDNDVAAATRAHFG